ncbi:MAG: hypothetical protein AAF291_00830 [Pseudomonadota bacterium]
MGLTRTEFIRRLRETNAAALDPSTVATDLLGARLRLVEEAVAEILERLEDAPEGADDVRA